MCPPKAPKVGLGFVLIFHVLVPRSPFPVPRFSNIPPYGSATRVDGEHYTIQANFVRVNERKKLRYVYWLRSTRIEKGSRAIITSIVS